MKQIPTRIPIRMATLLAGFMLAILIPRVSRAADEAPAPLAPSTIPAGLESTSQPVNATVTQLVPPTHWWVSGTTAHGQTWSGMSGESSPQAVIESVSHARIPKFFTGPIVFGDEIVDDKDQQAAIPFAAMLHGHAVRGEFIATAYPPVGVECSAILADANASAEEFTQLASAIPVIAKLQPVDLPGGRVTGLPEGWKLVSVDPATGTFFASGPKGETITWGATISFVTPAYARTDLGKQPPVDKAVISDALAPLDVLKLLYDGAPAKTGKPVSRKLDKIVWSATQPSSKWSQSETSEYTVVVTNPDAAPFERRAVGSIGVIPSDVGLWFAIVDETSVPEAQFAKSYPTMTLIIGCYTEEMMTQRKMTRDVDRIGVDPMLPPAPPPLGCDKQTFLEREAARELVTKDAGWMGQTTVVHLPASAAATEAASAVTLHDIETGAVVSISLCNEDVLVDALNDKAGEKRFTGQKLPDAK